MGPRCHLLETTQSSLSWPQAFRILFPVGVNGLKHRLKESFACSATLFLFRPDFLRLIPEVFVSADPLRQTNNRRAIKSDRDRPDPVKYLTSAATMMKVTLAQVLHCHMSIYGKLDP